VEQIIRKTTRLIAARNRERQPEREHLQRPLTKVETEIMNIMSAIKAGILTVSTKAELEQAEAERDEGRQAGNITPARTGALPCTGPEF